VGFCFFSHFAPVITAQQNWDNHTRYLMSLPSFLFGRFVRLFLCCFWVFLVCAAVGVILLVIFALQRGSFKEEFKLQPGLPHNNFTCVVQPWIIINWNVFQPSYWVGWFPV
jgi:hypothetical protein